MMDKYAVRALWETQPDLEPIILDIRTSNSDTFVAYQVPRARKRGLSRKEILRYPTLLNSAELVFEVFQPNLQASNPPNCPAPVADDILIDAQGILWAVIMVDGQVFGGGEASVLTIYCRRGN